MNPAPIVENWKNYMYVYDNQGFTQKGDRLEFDFSVSRDKKYYKYIIYIFLVVLFFLIVYIVYKIVKKDNNTVSSEEEKNLK